MADRTWHGVMICDVPDDEIQTVIQILIPYGFDLPEEGFEIGTVYSIDETRVGTSQDVARELIAEAPGTSFRAWEDPKYDYLGTVSWYTPQRGLFQQSADADGSPVFYTDEVLKMRAGGSGVTWAHALGINHDESLNALVAIHQKNDDIIRKPKEG